VSGLSGLDSAQEKSKVRVTGYPGGDLFEENVVVVYVAERRKCLGRLEQRGDGKRSVCPRVPRVPPEFPEFPVPEFPPLLNSSATASIYPERKEPDWRPESPPLQIGTLKDYSRRRASKRAHEMQKGRPIRRFRALAVSVAHPSALVKVAFLLQNFMFHCRVPLDAQPRFRYSPRCLGDYGKRKTRCAPGYPGSSNS
jgi:hypothetical protein